MHAFILYILCQRLPVLLELLRFFPPLTYMGQSWEVSIWTETKNKRKRCSRLLQKKDKLCWYSRSSFDVRRVASLLPKCATKLGFRKQDCIVFATKANLGYVQRKGFATSTVLYLLFTWVSWNQNPQSYHSGHRCSFHVHHYLFGVLYLTLVWLRLGEIEKMKILR